MTAREMIRNIFTRASQTADWETIKKMVAEDVSLAWFATDNRCILAHRAASYGRVDVLNHIVSASLKHFEKHSLGKDEREKIWCMGFGARNIYRETAQQIALKFDYWDCLVLLADHLPPIESFPRHLPEICFSYTSRRVRVRIRNPHIPLPAISASIAGSSCGGARIAPLP